MISSITDNVIDAANEWQNRKLKSLYTFVFVDCLTELYKKWGTRYGTQPTRNRRQTPSTHSEIREILIRTKMQIAHV